MTEDRKAVVGISAITHIGNSEILIGNENGAISRYRVIIRRYPNGYRNFENIRNYIDDNERKKICFLVYCFEGKFSSVNEDSEIRIWEMSTGICIKKLHSHHMHRIDSVAALSSNLLAVSGYSTDHICPIAWGCFNVWDLHSGECIIEKKGMVHKPLGMSLRTTAEGYLTVSGNCHSGVSLWHISCTESTLISRIETGRIYSMAVLPTGDIVTGSHNLDFYSISGNEYFKYKTLKNSNVIDQIHPVAGYKLITVDRSRRCPLKLWNYISGSYENLESTADIVAGYKLITVVEESGYVVTMGKNELIVDKFSPRKFFFPRKLAEIRKNARLLSQACRTEMNFFVKLPKEITIKILLLTADDMNAYERKISEKIAWNHFCKPQS